MHVYQRVVPRDLFNESKLLKCLGQLALLAHDGLVKLTVENSGDEFRINQRSHDGGLYVCDGIQFKRGQLVLDLFSLYNSKEPYPLMCETEDGEVCVFNDDGSLTDEFSEYISTPA